MIGIAIAWSDLENKIKLKHRPWNKEQWGLCRYSEGCFLPNNSGGCAGTVWVALQQRRCAVGLLYLRRPVQAVLMGEEGEGGFLCSWVKRERESKLCFLLKANFSVLYIKNGANSLPSWQMQSLKIKCIKYNFFIF